MRFERKTTEFADNMKKKFEIKQLIILGITLFLILLFAGCTSTNEGDDNQNASDNNGSSSDSNDDASDYAVNVDKNLVGNWTWTCGTSNGEPVTHISSGWVNFKKNGTWMYAYDYGYTITIQNGTWQAKDGQLYWGTDGSEISDWYSINSYELVNSNELVISTDSSDSLYIKQ